MAYSYANCQDCDGTGKVVNRNDEEIDCTACGGSGKLRYEDDQGEHEDNKKDQD